MIAHPKPADPEVERIFNRMYLNRGKSRILITSRPLPRRV